MLARFCGFSLDSGERQLRNDRGVIHLTPKALDLLTLLVAEAPRVVRKMELHRRLWPDTFVSDAALVVLVKELRRALNDRKRSAPIIRTEHGVGYALAAPIDRPASRHLGISLWVVAGRRRIALEMGENLIGRDPAAAIHVDAPGVSRRHARILVDEDGARLEDLGSKNGTSVGGERVAFPVKLEDGNRVVIGPVVIVFHSASTGPSTETLMGRSSRAGG